MALRFQSRIKTAPRLRMHISQSRAALYGLE